MCTFDKHLIIFYIILQICVTNSYKVLSSFLFYALAKLMCQLTHIEWLIRYT